jgi:hypothetical protein
MTVDELVRRVRAAGADVIFRGLTLGVVHARRLDPETIQELRLHARELWNVLGGSRAVEEATMIAFTARLLCESRSPEPAFGSCLFFVRQARRKKCARCGAIQHEHHRAGRHVTRH